MKKVFISIVLILIYTNAFASASISPSTTEKLNTSSFLSSGSNVSFYIDNFIGLSIASEDHHWYYRIPIGTVTFSVTRQKKGYSFYAAKIETNTVGSWSTNPSLNTSLDVNLTAGSAISITTSSSVPGKEICLYTRATASAVGDNLLSNNSGRVSFVTCAYGYNLAYNANGGSGAPASSLVWTNNTTHTFTVSSGTPTRTGYTFKGWSTSSTGSVNYAPGSSYTASGATLTTSASTYKTITLYAVWEPIPYTATFDYNGGSGSPSSTSFNIESSFSLPATPTKIGNSFTNWKITTANGNWANGSTFSAGAATSTGKYGNVTFTAQYSENTYTLTLLPDGGSVSQTSITYKSSDTTTLPTPTKAGHIFDGWKVTIADGNWTINSTYPAGTSVKDMYGNTTLTAQWTTITYNISFNGNGSTSGSMSNMTGLQADSDVTLTSNAFVRQYNVTYDANGGTCSTSSQTSTYQFNGWEDRGSMTYNGTVYSYTQFDAPFYANAYGDLYNAFKYNKYDLLGHYVNYGKGEGRQAVGATPGTYPNGATVKNLATENNATVPLYAQWTPQSVTLPTPTRNGCTFNGWYTQASGGSKVGDAGASYTPTATVTLHSQWTPIDYSITYDVNGGSAVTSPQSYNIESTSKLATTSRNGYTFTGWKATSASEGSWTQNTIYSSGLSLNGKTGNVSLQAQWTKNNYTATFNPNGGSVTPTSSNLCVDQALSLPTPSWVGHTFNGWKVTTAAGNWVLNETYTSTSVAAGKYGNVEFTAQWSDIPRGNLTVEVLGLQNNDSAICTVVSSVDGSKYTVALSASNNSVTIKNVYAGSYTVTSEGWQWSYNLSGTNPKTASVSKDSTAKISFTLSEKSDNPKHDSVHKENILKQE